MDLAAAFYISVYSLAALAGAILAWAEFEPSVTILTAPVAIALLFLNEKYRVLRLDGGWIALAGFMAFAYPAMEFFRGDEEFRLLSGAHLLTILQWVLLSYNKTAHQYWWICALSCLQVAIAAVLTNSPVFGIFILIYMFWALWTLSIYTLLLARLRFGRGDQTYTRPQTWQWPALSRGDSETAAKPSPADDEVLALESSDKKQVFRASEFRGSFQCEPHETDLNWRFVFGILGMSSVALILGLVMFLLTPRLWIGTGNPFQDDFVTRSGRRNITGFSETVRLNDFGRILESSAPVLELRLFDDVTDAPLSMSTALREVGQNEILLRGMALAIYDRGAWLPSESNMRQDVPIGNSPFSPKPSPLIRQEINLQPIGTNTLFTLGHPVYLKVSNTDVRAKKQTHTGTISLPTRGTMISLGTQYTVWSIPQPSSGLHNRMSGDRLPSIYSTPPENLPRLMEETKRILEPLQKKTLNNPVTQSQIAQVLLTYLRDSQQFHYSLERPAIVPNIDPIEDFLLNRKTGHCQYFAAALGLMLRVEGIPTCVITGFKGGIEDVDRQVIEIQQRHAHAWVEAYIDGNWVTLDPTPHDEREDSLQAVGDRMRFWHKLSALGTSFWNDYVLNLSYNKQQQDLYGPIQKLLSSLTGQNRDRASITSLLAEFLRQFVYHPERWFSWQGGLVAFLLMTCILGTFYLVRTIFRYARQLLQHGQMTQRESLRVEFHQRFLALLKPLGLIPSDYQTQCEFAAFVASEWSLYGLPPDLEPLGKQIAQAFDRLRFGHQTIPETEQKQIFAALKHLEDSLQNKLEKNEKDRHLLDS